MNPLAIIAGVCFARNGLAYVTTGVCSDWAYEGLKRVGLRGMVLMGGGFGLNRVGPPVVEEEEDEEEDEEATVVSLPPLPSEWAPFDNGLFSPSFSELLAEELRLTGEQSLEKLEISPVMGEDVAERFDGDRDRLESGDGTTGL